MAKADEILEAVYKSLGLKSDQDKYQNVYKIIEELQTRNDRQAIHVGTTGTITERMVEVALRLSTPKCYYAVREQYLKWVGDFVLFGVPFNLIISVKSFTTKERLLVSGSGTALAPTIGYGWFKDPKEFERIQRLRAYKQRGFLAIYMPNYTHEVLSKEVRDEKNLNGRPLLRLIENFPNDLKGSVHRRKLSGKEVDLVKADRL